MRYQPEYAPHGKLAVRLSLNLAALCTTWAKHNSSERCKVARRADCELSVLSKFWQILRRKEGFHLYVTFFMARTCLGRAYHFLQTFILGPVDFSDFICACIPLRKKSFDPFSFPDPHWRQSSVGKARREGGGKKGEEGTWHELLVTTLHFFAALPLGCSHVTSQVLFSGGGGFAVK